MALVSMAIPEENEAIESNSYGYGLCIRLNPGQCEALGITTPPKAGTPMKLTARAIAKRVTEEADEGEGETEVYLELQITDMEIGDASRSQSESATMLYGGDAD